MKENSSCQALPLIPTMPRMTNVIATRNISFYFSSNPPAGVRRTDHHADHEYCYQHAAEKWTSLHESIRTVGAGILFLSNSASSLRTQTRPFGHDHQEQRLQDYCCYSLLWSPFPLGQFLLSILLVMGWVILFTETGWINLKFLHVSTEENNHNLQTALPKWILWFQTCLFVSVWSTQCRITSNAF